jgi:hypothetical protein
VSIPSVKGDFLGTEVEGMQKTTGTIGGITEGKGVSTLGDMEGTGIVEDESGSSPIEKVRRRVRSGIKIGFDNKPEILMEGWIDPGQQVIVINTGYPSFKTAGAMYAEHYHVLRCVVDALLREVELENPNKLRAAFFSKWFEQQSK